MTGGSDCASAITWWLYTMAAFLDITAWCRFTKSSRTLALS